VAKWIDNTEKIKSETINKVNNEISLIQKNHFKHLNKINRLNLEGFKQMRDHIDASFGKRAELINEKTECLNNKTDYLKILLRKNDLKTTIMLVIIMLLTLTNLFR
jgi:DNA-directed RNA polymerase subunit F